MYRRGVAPPSQVVIDAPTEAQIVEALTSKAEIIAALARDAGYTLRGQDTTGATVRLTFSHEAQTGFVWEFDTWGRPMCEVTDGTVPLDEADDLARLYAAARGLPVSRVDVP
jgi:hypothetical protein